jgi:hypothetical protein
VAAPNVERVATERVNARLRAGRPLLPAAGAKRAFYVPKGGSFARLDD